MRKFFIYAMSIVMIGSPVSNLHASATTTTQELVKNYKKTKVLSILWDVAEDGFKDTKEITNMEEFKIWVDTLKESDIVKKYRKSSDGRKENLLTIASRAAKVEMVEYLLTKSSVQKKKYIEEALVAVEKVYKALQSRTDKRSQTDNKNRFIIIKILNKQLIKNLK
ncbi:MAG TPA: hypothetical protein DD412_01650 [Holosporales bacterium]|nr:hypothetical protein [Holosporales bacterium]